MFPSLVILQVVLVGKSCSTVKAFYLKSLMIIPPCATSMKRFIMIRFPVPPTRNEVVSPVHSKGPEADNFVPSPRGNDDNFVPSTSTELINKDKRSKKTKQD